MRTEQDVRRIKGALETILTAVKLGIVFPEPKRLYAAQVLDGMFIWLLQEPGAESEEMLKVLEDLKRKFEILETMKAKPS